jgi:hypothetical protein
MLGDSGTLIPEGLVRPVDWPEFGVTPPKNEEVEAPSPVRFTPPAEFITRQWQLDVQHIPERPQSRRSSATPIDTAKAEMTFTAYESLLSTFCSALRKYKREDVDLSNRVRPAEQLLVTAEALLKAARAKPEEFLPTL